MQFRKKPVVIDAITFEQLVQYGRENGANIVGGMPWSFNYKGHPITHENDTCYIVPTLEGSMRFTPDDMLITGVKGEIYPCKKDIFFATYEPAEVSCSGIEQEIQAKGLTAPRITPTDIEANIASAHYFTAQHGVLGMLASDGVPATAYEKATAAPVALRLLTFCVLVLRNGFTVTGESACASPENFDAELGNKIAHDNAISKVWPLMGYALKQRLHEAG